MTTLDYIIIGGGSAGSVLAGRLTEDPGVQVALIEAGSPDSSVFIHCPAGLAMIAKSGAANWKFNTTPQPGLNGRQGYMPRGKVLGGSSSINAMIYLRGQREDYDAWAAAGNPGWSFDELLPYFKRSEHNERGADAWHATGGPLNVMDLRCPNPVAERFVQACEQAGIPRNPDFNGATQAGAGMYQVTHKNGERFSAAKAYLTPHLNRPNLHVVTGAHVTRILLQRQGDHLQAKGVEYHEGGQLKQLMCQREVLLSAGAIQSPQILMLSGIGPREHLVSNGIALQHELPGVGQNLHDHPDVVLGTNAPSAKDLFGITPGGIVRVLKGISEWRSARTGMLTTNFAEAGAFFATRAGETRPDVQLHFVIGKLVNHGRTTTLGLGHSCHVCVLRPKSRGSVGLASNDPLAAPLIDPNFLGDADDMRRMVDGFKQMRRILKQPALAALGGTESRTSASAQSDAEIEAFIRDHADTIYHPVGTCRMGPGPLDVVDAELRVHGVEGLRVVDASIMPSLISGNTNAPVMAMAEKAVDMIRAAAKN